MKRFLHVGCGHNRKNHTTTGFNRSDWQEIRLDIDPIVSPDIIGTMTDLSKISSGSVEAVFSSHNIEHLYPHEVPLALREFLRVLAPGGFVVVTCPDLRSVARLIAEDKLIEPAYVSPAGPIAPLDILFGHRASLSRGNLFMAHHCGFTLKVLQATLLEAGFASVIGMARPQNFDLWAIATRELTDEPALRKIASEHLPIAPSSTR